jgi:hypothetical protein
MPASTGKRCVVNVATGPYAALQEDLVRSLASVGYMGGLLAWTEIPEGSPTHADDPYAFKLHAFLNAIDQGFRSVLWLDAPCVVTGPLDPLFERIETEGHLFITDGARLGNWASDACLGAFDLSRDGAMKLPLLNGTFIGLELANERSLRWLAQMRAARLRGLFRGPWLSEHAPTEVRAKKPGREIGFVSTDSRAWGHRHDEAVGSCIASTLGMAISPQAGLFNTDGAPVRSSKA